MVIETFSGGKITLSKPSLPITHIKCVVASNSHTYGAKKHDVQFLRAWLGMFSLPARLQLLHAALSQQR
jgi:hypothetical protein